jgi:hypothetical protein
VNRDEILEELENSRIQLLELLEPIPDETLIEPGTIGEWSIADVLAHLTAWESELVTLLMQVDQGKKPEKWLQAAADIQAYNDQRYQENKGRDLDRIFGDFHDVRIQLEEWLEEFSDRQLNDPDRYPWAKGRPLWLFIEECSFGHEEEHLEDLEEFVTRWEGKSNDRKQKNESD